jgi:hypothetical protein
MSRCPVSRIMISIATPTGARIRANMNAHHSLRMSHAQPGGPLKNGPAAASIRPWRRLPLPSATVPRTRRALPAR